LSAYKVILENSKEFSKRQVANHGYMRLVCNGVTHYKKVDLMTEEDIVALYAGITEPNKANTPGKCTKCHQLAHCGGVKRYKRRSSSSPKKGSSRGGF